MTDLVTGSRATDHTSLPQLDTTVLYQSGLGNEFETEALPGALPVGQNSPQKVAYGLVSELASGTTFAAPRALNKRSYMFRIRPSVLHGKFKEMDRGTLLTPPFEQPAAPHDYCWGPFKSQTDTGDFVDSLATICGNGSPYSQSGMSVHVFSTRTSMRDRVFSNADAEMLLVPHLGRLRVVTELGILELSRGDVAVVPKGIRFRVELMDSYAGGFVCENFGLPLRLPELGLIGSNGLANVSDFQIPVAAFEDIDEPVEWVHKYGGRLWASALDHSPLDVVAWRGSLYPYKYDMRRFVAMSTATVDHPDPSIFCLLTSPSDHILGPNFDVMALTPRWVVAENSFRPPGYHRNAVCEFVLLLEGQFGDLEPGSSTLTNNWTPHGPDTQTLDFFREGIQPPMKVEDQLLLLFESRFPMQTTDFANTAMPTVDSYAQQWDGFTKRFGQ